MVVAADGSLGAGIVGGTLLVAFVSILTALDRVRFRWWLVRPTVVKTLASWKRMDGVSLERFHKIVGFLVKGFAFGSMLILSGLVVVEVLLVAKKPKWGSFVQKPLAVLCLGVYMLVVLWIGRMWTRNQFLVARTLHFVRSFGAFDDAPGGALNSNEKRFGNAIFFLSGLACLFFLASQAFLLQMGRCWEEFETDGQCDGKPIEAWSMIDVQWPRAASFVFMFLSSLFMAVALLHLDLYWNARDDIYLEMLSVKAEELCRSGAQGHSQDSGEIGAMIGSNSFSRSALTDTRVLQNYIEREKRKFCFWYAVSVANILLLATLHFVTTEVTYKFFEAVPVFLSDLLFMVNLKSYRRTSLVAVVLTCTRYLFAGMLSTTWFYAHAVIYVLTMVVTILIVLPSYIRNEDPRNPTSEELDAPFTKSSVKKSRAKIEWNTQRHQIVGLFSTFYFCLLVVLTRIPDIDGPLHLISKKSDAGTLMIKWGSAAERWIETWVIGVFSLSLVGFCLFQYAAILFWFRDGVKIGFIGSSSIAYAIISLTMNAYVDFATVKYALVAYPLLCCLVIANHEWRKDDFRVLLFNEANYTLIGSVALIFVLLCVWTTFLDLLAPLAIVVVISGSMLIQLWFNTLEISGMLFFLLLFHPGSALTALAFLPDRKLVMEDEENTFVAIVPFLVLVAPFFNGMLASLLAYLDSNFASGRFSLATSLVSVGWALFLLWYFNLSLTPLVLFFISWLLLNFHAVGLEFCRFSRRTRAVVFAISICWVLPIFYVIEVSLVDLVAAGATLVSGFVIILAAALLSFGQRKSFTLNVVKHYAGCSPFGVPIITYRAEFRGGILESSISSLIVAIVLLLLAQIVGLFMAVFVNGSGGVIVSVGSASFFVIFCVDRSISQQVAVREEVGRDQAFFKSVVEETVERCIVISQQAFFSSKIAKEGPFWEEASGQRQEVENENDENDFVTIRDVRMLVVFSTYIIGVEEENDEFLRDSLQYNALFRILYMMRSKQLRRGGENGRKTFQNGRGSNDFISWNSPSKVFEKESSGSTETRECRANEFIEDGRLRIFDDDDESNVTEIVQGDVGDCWLLSALSVVALRPALLRQIVLDDSINPDGRYRVRLFLDGEWETLIVDDLFPCVIGENDELEPKFCRSKSGAIWPLLVEKAFAQIYGSYDNLSGGYISEALTDMTGGFSQVFSLNTDLEMVASGSLWTHLVHFQDDGDLLLSAGTYNFEDDSVDGIRPGHAYAILDSREEWDARGWHRLIKVRDPWGLSEWNGAWSDSDKERWTRRMRNRVGISAEESADGIFWMSLEDFVVYFRDLHVCRIFNQPCWKSVHVTGTFGKEIFAVSFEARGHSKARNCGGQRSERRRRIFLSIAHLDGETGIREYPFLGLQVLRHTSREVKHGNAIPARDLVATTGSLKNVREVSLEMRLTESVQEHFILLPISAGGSSVSEFSINMFYFQNPAEELNVEITELLET